MPWTLLGPENEEILRRIYGLASWWLCRPRVQQALTPQLAMSVLGFLQTEVCADGLALRGTYGPILPSGNRCSVR